MLDINDETVGGVIIKKNHQECYTRWYCKERDYISICPDGSGRVCSRFCCKEHVEAGGISIIRHLIRHST